MSVSLCDVFVVVWFQGWYFGIDFGSETSFPLGRCPVFIVLSQNTHFNCVKWTLILTLRLQMEPKAKYFKLKHYNFWEELKIVAKTGVDF